jgi:hypothetical protein
MKSNIQEEIIDLSELLRPAVVDFAEPAPAPPPPPRAQSSEMKQPPPVEAPAKQIQFPADEAVQPISNELRSLLNHLKIVEDALMQGGDIQRTVVVFKLIHQRVLSVIEKIEALRSVLGTDHQRLREALDTTSFALKHEMRRVYDVEAKGLGELGGVRFSRSTLTRAYGLLQNCFQQSVITLTQVFNPALEGGELFEDYKARGEQSLVLRRELTVLLKKVRGITKDSGVLQMLNVINTLKRFRLETMHFLMYRDWEGFEAFVDEIITTYDEAGDLDPVIKRFAPYLETLINHVNMRTVLNSKKPVTY